MPLHQENPQSVIAYWQYLRKKCSENQNVTKKTSNSQSNSFLGFSANSETGKLKMREWKIRHGQNCGGGKCRSGNIGVEFYLYPTVGTVLLIHSVKPELTE